jgi:hypothetical protein
MDYPEDVPEPKPAAHLITVEIMSRLQELDELDNGNESLAPAGIRLVNRLAALERRSRRAYRLVIDLLGAQHSLSLSLDQLASKHSNSKGNPTSRQNWLQNAQTDVELIKAIYPEIGNVVGEILKRRPQE